MKALYKKYITLCKSHRLLAFCFVGLLISFISCSRQEQTISPLAEISLPLSVRINQLNMVNDTLWFACGGVRGAEGHIFRTADGGATWSTFTNEFNKSIYSVHMANEQFGIAGGEELHLWKTTDGGMHWNFHWLAAQVPFHVEDRPAVRDIHIASNLDYYFCAGENLGEGVMYESHDGGENWNFVFEQNELRSLAMGSNGQCLAGGHGAVYTFDWLLETWEQSNFSNDFITAVVHAENTDFYAASYNGAIYRSEDNGRSWHMVMEQNTAAQQRINWNTMHLQPGLIMVAGNGGWIAESKDAGTSWKLMRLENEANLYSLSTQANKWWASSDEGKLYRIK